MSKTTEITHEDLDEIAEYAAKLSEVFGFLDETKRKNFLIRREFRVLRETMTADAAEEKLSEKHFLSKDRIHVIIYKKK